MSKEVLKVKGVNHPKTQLGLLKMNTLIEAAEQLFEEVGFYQTSISDICKKANTAVGTFYIYFDSKIDVYRYLIESYKKEIKSLLAASIEGCSTRYEKEREGIKCFIKYALKKPTVYNLIWGSLSIDKQLFTDYYESFAKSYARSLSRDKDVSVSVDVTTVSYMLMGITNFLGLHAIFSDMNDAEIDEMMDRTVMPMLSSGIVNFTSGYQGGRDDNEK